MTLTLPAGVKVWGSHVAAVNRVLCTDASGWVLHVTFPSFLPVPVSFHPCVIYTTPWHTHRRCQTALG